MYHDNITSMYGKYNSRDQNVSIREIRDFFSNLIKNCLYENSFKFSKMLLHCHVKLIYYILLKSVETICIKKYKSLDIFVMFLYTYFFLVNKFSNLLDI